jgi:hypothetical protein
MLNGKALTVDDSATAHASARSGVPGRTGWWFYLVDGPLAGRWIQESSLVFLTPPPTPTPSPSPSPTSSPSG